MCHMGSVLTATQQRWHSHLPQPIKAATNDTNASPEITAWKLVSILCHITFITLYFLFIVLGSVQVQSGGAAIQWVGRVGIRQQLRQKRLEYVRQVWTQQTHTRSADIQARKLLNVNIYNYIQKNNNNCSYKFGKRLDCHPSWWQMGLSATCTSHEQTVYSACCTGISWAICKICTLTRHITTPAPHHSVFYRPDVLPAAQPAASKHFKGTYFWIRMTEDTNWAMSRTSCLVTTKTRSKSWWKLRLRTWNSDEHVSLLWLGMCT